MLKNKFNTLVFLALCSFLNPVSAIEYDKAGREIIRGTIVTEPGAVLENVRILAKQYGIIAKGELTLKNVFIDADVCIQHPGQGLRLYNNHFNCNLTIEYLSSMRIGNVAIDNKYAEEWSN